MTFVENIFNYSFLRLFIYLLFVFHSSIYSLRCRPYAVGRGDISATIRDVLEWLPIRQRVEFKLCVPVFNSLHSLAPNYLSTMCQLVAENPSRWYLRSAARGDLAVPVTRTTRYGPRSFAVAGPSAWNSLPAPLL